MKVSKAKLVTAAALGAALLGAAVGAQAFSGEKYAKEAHISLEQARAVALKAFPGKIADQELEREKGGSGLRYSFDIVSGKTRQEVGVDAKSGKLIENSVEGPNAD
ncbi:MAG TPA: PepSY domain-containing protein [Burkholderiales bacterium]|nr:PepSY domain-containing protein [Burkholderiales bacterium]